MPPLLLHWSQHIKCLFPLAGFMTVYFQKHLAQKGREEEKTDIHATLSARTGWQYHIVNQEGALVVWLDSEVYGSSSTNNKWYWCQQGAIWLWPPPHNTGHRTSLNLIPVSNQIVELELHFRELAKIDFNIFSDRQSTTTLGQMLINLISPATKNIHLLSGLN